MQIGDIVRYRHGDTTGVVQQVEGDRVQINTPYNRVWADVALLDVVASIDRAKGEDFGMVSVYDSETGETRPVVSANLAYEMRRLSFVTGYKYDDLRSDFLEWAKERGGDPLDLASACVELATHGCLLPWEPTPKCRCVVPEWRELGQGWYYTDLTDAETSTNGPLILEERGIVTESVEEKPFTLDSPDIIIETGRPPFGPAITFAGPESLRLLGCVMELAKTASERAMIMDQWSREDQESMMSVIDSTLEAIENAR